MTAYQFVGYSMIQASAITSIVGASTQSRIAHGTRPQSSALSYLPSINYYELAGNRKNGLEYQSFSINCRAITADTAMNLAKKVVDLFDGTSGSGIYGTMNNFTVSRVALRNLNGLIPEPDSECFNVPVDILLTYSVNTVT
jgi:hypothetical protein